MTSTVEIRCPVGPRKLFIRLKLGEEFATITPGNCMEITCWDCAKRVGRERQKRVRVFHSFDFAGDLISTRVEDLE